MVRTLDEFIHALTTHPGQLDAIRETLPALAPHIRQELQRGIPGVFTVNLDEAESDGRGGFEVYWKFAAMEDWHCRNTTACEQARASLARCGKNQAVLAFVWNGGAGFACHIVTVPPARGRVEGH